MCKPYTSIWYMCTVYCTYIYMYLPWSDGGSVSLWKAKRSLCLNSCIRYEPKRKHLLGYSTCMWSMRQGKVRQLRRRQLILFPQEKKEEVPQGGLEPTTFCIPCMFMDRYQKSCCNIHFYGAALGNIHIIVKTCSKSPSSYESSWQLECIR